MELKKGKITEAELVAQYGSDTQKKSYAANGKLLTKNKHTLLSKLSRYCTIKDLGQREYRITQVYDYPLPSNWAKMNKSLYQYIIPLILNSLINGHDQNNKINITVGKWAREINMVNRNYNLIKYNPNDGSAETKIALDTINEFYDKADYMINWYITNALDYLKSAGLIIWRESNRVSVEVSDESAIIDQDGNVRVNINIDNHQASEDEMEYYAECIDVADKECGIENAKERYYSHKSKKFNEILKRELYKRKIKSIYKTYEAYYINLDKCKGLLNHFGKVNYQTLINKFNRDFSQMIIENADKRFENNAKKYLYTDKNEYRSDFSSLCDITINNKTDYLGGKISEKQKDDEYSLQITHVIQPTENKDTEGGITKINDR